MATLLDATILKNFTQIFSMVLVIAIVYGILQTTKALGENRGIHILIAFIIGLLVLLIPDVSSLIGGMIPWFTLFFIFILFVLVSYKIFGVTDSDIASYMKADRTLGWVILIVCIVIVIGAFSNVYGQRFVPLTGAGDSGTADVVESTAGTAIGGEARDVATTSFSGNLAATFFHPKVLGIIFIFLVGVFTIAILAMEPRP